MSHPVPPFVLALDQGTTSSRALVFDARGVPVAVAQRELAQHFPAPGEVEHDANEIWSAQIGVAHEALAAARLTARDVAAIGITNQRETTVVWDRRTGAPIHRAIVWQDRRTAAHCARLVADGHEPAVTARTGLVIDPYFSATKIAWLLDAVPGARARAERGELAFGTVDSWLVWKLTDGAEHVTDVTNASRTLLYDIAAGDWSDALCALFGVPRAMLPRVVPSSGVVATSAPHLLGAPVPIAGIAGDQQAALYGQGCHRPGRAKNTYGTGCFMLLHTGTTQSASRARLVATRTADPGPAQFALEGSVFVAGAAVQWLRDGLGIITRAAEIEALAASVPDAGGVLFVPAFAGLGAPYWDAGARGTIVGLTRGTTRAHIAHATLEAIALQSADVLEAMRADAQVPITDLRVDGGAAANDLLMQMQADLLGAVVARPRVLESTALGAAQLAGLATGVWPSREALDRLWECDREFAPRWTEDRRLERLATWRRAIARARDWVPPS
jgi:glycerol kinase